MTILGVGTLIDGITRQVELIGDGVSETFFEPVIRLGVTGLSACAPGRFLMLGEMAGSPALTFSPLLASKAPCHLIAREMARRYEAYKGRWCTRFSRIDRQVVLIDALAKIMETFKARRNGWFSALRGKSVERVLFAATKADHLHQSQHQGARTDAMAIASLRTTTEET